VIVVTTVNDIRSLMDDFTRRLVNGNGLNKARVDAAVLKVAKLMALRVVEQQMTGEPSRCTACPIHAEELDGGQACGHGNVMADVVLVGQGLGATEAQFRLPFVGIAGVLLTIALEDVHLPRETVWLSNIVCCRPKDNRAPAKAEAQRCMSLYLYNELAVIRPKAVVALGASALQAVVNTQDLTESRISRLRGQWFEMKVGQFLFPVIATYHPAYVVRKHGEQFKQVYSEFLSDLRSATVRAAAPADTAS